MSSKNTRKRSYDKSFLKLGFTKLQKKPHTIGQNLVMSVAKEIVEIMIEEKERKLLDPISLSASTVKQRISGMSNDVLEQTVSQVNASPFYAIQLDESTDIAGQPQLLVFVRFVNGDEVVEELLFCNTLKLHCRGKTFLVVLMDFSAIILYLGKTALEFVSMVQQHAPKSIPEL